MLKPEQLQQFCNTQWQQEILPSLMDYIKIPNKSPDFDPEWQQHGYMQQAIEHLQQWCIAHAPQGMQIEIVQLADRTPLLFIEIAGQGDQPVLLYGHLDKQPEMTGWCYDLGPWKPVLKNERLYGRGAADDGYSVYAAITAINALQQHQLAHPPCIIIIEASEESGSVDLPFYMEHLQKRISEPGLVICLDSGAGNYEQLWVTTSLRGNIVGELTVQLLKEGLHSGYASGIAADTFRIIRQLLSRIENEVNGEILLNDMHCEIPEQRLTQAAHCAEILGEEIINSLPWVQNAKPLTENLAELLLNRSWRPSLTVTGAAGLPTITNAGNVLRPKTTLKLSLRTPPLVCPIKASVALNKALTENAPYGAKINFTVENTASGWNAPLTPPWLLAASDVASQLFFKKPAAYIGEGGTIPFMAMLGQQFPQAEFLITGVLGPNSNAHGPNEFLHIPMVQKLTACMAMVLHQYLDRLSKSI